MEENKWKRKKNNKWRILDFIDFFFYLSKIFIAFISWRLNGYMTPPKRETEPKQCPHH